LDKTLAIIKKFLGKENIEKIEYLQHNYIIKYKIVVFTPADKVNDIAFAMSLGGAGKIGEYTNCSFRIRGEGTFKGSKKTNPYLGKKGNLEKVDEIRLEMICDFNHLDNAIERMLKVHPYEEPAYEIYEVLVRSKIVKKILPVKISLKKPIPLTWILSFINFKIDAHHLPEQYSRTKYKELILDTSYSNENVFPSSDKKILYLKKKQNGTFNLRLN
jgi:hypothetical protein